MFEKDIEVEQSPQFLQYLANILQDVAVVEGIENDIHILSSMYKLMHKTCPMYALIGELCDECRSFMQEKVIQLRLDRRDEIVS